MLEVSEKAAEMITDFLNGQEPPHSIRITMNAGCGGPSLGMALDEPLAEDEVIEEKGLTFLIDKTLLDEAKPINIDFITTPHGSGFKLSSPLTENAGGGCGGDCCSC